METEMKDALKEYGRLIKRKGYAAGLPMILKYKKRFKDFEKWASALAVVLRAEELLEERRNRGAAGTNPKGE